MNYIVACRAQCIL